MTKHLTCLSGALALLALFATSATAQITHYVPGDSGGVPAYPTIAAAMGAAAPGDTIALDNIGTFPGGVYPEEVLVTVDNITIDGSFATPPGPAGAIIDGGVAPTVMQSCIGINPIGPGVVNTCTINNVTLTNAAANGGNFGLVVQFAATVNVNNSVLAGSPGEGIIITDFSGPMGGDTTLNLTGCNIDASVGGNGINCHPNQINGAADSVIINMNNTTVDGNSGAGIGMFSGGPNNQLNATGGSVSGNGGSGIVTNVDLQTGFIVNGTVIDTNGANGIDFAAGSIVNPTLTGASIDGNAANGLRFAVSAIPTFNGATTIDGNGQNGVLMEGGVVFPTLNISGGCTINNNVRCGIDGFLSGSGNVINLTGSVINGNNPSNTGGPLGGVILGNVDQTLNMDGAQIGGNGGFGIQTGVLGTHTITMINGAQVNLNTGPGMSLKGSVINVTASGASNISQNLYGITCEDIPGFGNIVANINLSGGCTLNGNTQQAFYPAGAEAGVHNITIDGCNLDGNAARALYIENGQIVRLTATNCSIQNTGFDAFDSGINTSATLTFTNCNLNGGAVHRAGFNGNYLDLTLDNTTMNNGPNWGLVTGANNAALGGSGVGAFFGLTMLNGSQINSNGHIGVQSSGFVAVDVNIDGSAIDLAGNNGLDVIGNDPTQTSIVLNNASISNAGATGLHAAGGTVAIASSTIAGNGGGGINIDVAGGAGLTVTDTVINHASGGWAITSLTTGTNNIDLNSASVINGVSGIRLRGSGTVNLNGVDVIGNGGETFLVDPQPGIANVIVNTGGGDIRAATAWALRGFGGFGSSITVDTGGGTIEGGHPGSPNWPAVWAQAGFAFDIDLGGGAINGINNRPAVWVEGTAGPCTITGPGTVTGNYDGGTIGYFAAGPSTLTMTDIDMTGGLTVGGSANANVSDLLIDSAAPNTAGLALTTTGNYTVALASGSTVTGVNYGMQLRGTGTVDAPGAYVAGALDGILADGGGTTATVITVDLGGGTVAGTGGNGRGIRKVTDGGVLNVDMQGGDVLNNSNNYPCIWLQSPGELNFSLGGGNVSNTGTNNAISISGNPATSIANIDLGGGTVTATTGAGGSALLNNGQTVCTGPGLLQNGTWAVSNNGAGNLTLRDLNVDGNGDGSAIYQQIVTSGDLVLENVTATCSAGGGQCVEVANIGNPGWQHTGNVTITSCTLEGGPANGLYGYSSGTWTVTNTIIRNNAEQGVFPNANATDRVYPNIVMTDCDIVDNGNFGLNIPDGNVTLSGCDVSDNTSWGMSVSDGVTTLTDCQVLRNGWRGLNIAGGNVTIANSAVSDNLGDGGNSGIYVAGPAELAVANTTVSNNGPIQFWVVGPASASRVTISDCLVSTGSWGTLFDATNCTVTVTDTTYRNLGQAQRVFGSGTTLDVVGCSFDRAGNMHLQYGPTTYTACLFMNSESPLVENSEVTIQLCEFVDNSVVALSGTAGSTVTVTSCTLENLTRTAAAYNVNAGGTVGTLNVVATDHYTTGSSMLHMTTGTLVADFHACTFLKAAGARNPNWFLLDYGTSATAFTFDQCDFINAGGTGLNGLSTMWIRTAAGSGLPADFPGTVVVVDSIIRNGNSYSDQLSGSTQSYNLLDNAAFAVSGAAAPGAGFQDGTGTIDGDAAYQTIAFGDPGYLFKTEGLSDAIGLNSGNGPETYAGAKGVYVPPNAVELWMLY